MTLSELDVIQYFNTLYELSFEILTLLAWNHIVPIEDLLNKTAS